MNRSESQTSEYLLQVDNLHKTFYDSGAPIQVLRGASLRMLPNTNISIAGQSGSGKSTFLNVICGLESFDEGKILWNQTAIDQLRLRELSKMRGSFFGFVFQSYYLVSELNTTENVLLPARMIGNLSKETRQRATNLLELVGLSNRLKHNVQKLSGGERQRVAIARALINNPHIILADEPTGNLDESTADEVMELIFDICKKNGSSLLLVTHNPEYAKLTHQQYYLHDGTLT